MNEATGAGAAAAADAALAAGGMDGAPIGAMAGGGALTAAMGAMAMAGLAATGNGRRAVQCLGPTTVALGAIGAGIMGGAETGWMIAAGGAVMVLEAALFAVRGRGMAVRNAGEAAR